MASDRRTRKGEKTQAFERRVKGRKGIGKFAGLMAADEMLLETSCGGTSITLQLNKREILESSADLETIDLPIGTRKCSATKHGTKIVLNRMNQALAFPNPDRLRQILALEYGRVQDFLITVNGERLTMDDLPGRSVQDQFSHPDCGDVRLRLKIGDGGKTFKNPGLVVRVAGKVVGRPTFLGLEDDPEIPERLRKQICGEIDIDDLPDGVTADWGDLIENHKVVMQIKEMALVKVKAALEEAFKRDIRLMRNRLQREQIRRLESLPEHRRRLTEAALERLFKRFFRDNDDKFEILASLVIDAFEHDEYWSVLQEIEAAKRSDVAAVAEALEEFGLADMAIITSQTRSREQFLDALDELVSNPETREIELHRALENNLWILGHEYSVLHSNKTLRRMVEDLTGTSYSGATPNERPDLLLTENVESRRVLIEFKRPSHLISREDEIQATRYVDELGRHWPGGRIEILLIGSGRSPSSGPDLMPHSRIMSYRGLISKARSELAWLLGSLRA